MRKLLFVLITCISFSRCSTSTNDNGGTNTTVIPLAPSNLTASVLSTTQASLSWIDVSTNETGFKIQRKSLGGTFAEIGITGSEITNFVDAGLTPDITYTYRVYSFNSAGNSLNYSNEISIKLNSSHSCGVSDVHNESLTYGSMVDQDGNIYRTIQIGTQTWMAENLKVRKYLNGDIIPIVTNNINWQNLSSDATCWFNNDSASNNCPYGKFYNWFAVNDPRGLAPQGWHIPSDAELTTLSNYLGGQNSCGGKLKSISSLWNTPNLGGVNTSGFSALPSGYRDNNGTYLAQNINFILFSKTSYSLDNQSALTRTLSSNYSLLGRDPFDKNSGFSIRCVKD